MKKSGCHYGVGQRFARCHPGNQTVEGIEYRNRSQSDERAQNAETSAGICRKRRG